MLIEDNLAIYLKMHISLHQRISHVKLHVYVYIKLFIEAYSLFLVYNSKRLEPQIPARGNWLNNVTVLQQYARQL